MSAVRDAPAARRPDRGRSFQDAWWRAGLVRAVGAVDLLIAGCAIVNDATVLAADHDFDPIATVCDLRHECIVPSS